MKISPPDLIAVKSGCGPASYKWDIGKGDV